MIHGVDSNKSDGYMLDLIKDIYEMDYSVFAFDLRAHGDSEGSDLGLAYVERKDLKASINYLRDYYAIEDMVLYGISYGGTIVLSNSSMDPAIKGIIADSPFYDLPELMAAEVSSRTFIPLKLTFKCFNTFDIAKEKPHCGTSGVPFINKQT